MLTVVSASPLEAIISVGNNCHSVRQSTPVMMASDDDAEMSANTDSKPRRPNSLANNVSNYADAGREALGILAEYSRFPWTAYCLTPRNIKTSHI